MLHAPAARRHAACCMHDGIAVDIYGPDGPTQQISISNIGNRLCLEHMERRIIAGAGRSTKPCPTRAPWPMETARSSESRSREQFEGENHRNSNSRGDKCKVQGAGWSRYRETRRTVLAERAQFQPPVPRQWPRIDSGSRALILECVTNPEGNPVGPWPSIITGHAESPLGLAWIVSNGHQESDDEAMIFPYHRGPICQQLPPRLYCHFPLRLSSAASSHQSQLPEPGGSESKPGGSESEPRLRARSR